ncbi:MAG: hypothetical protein IPK22_00195 [Verrucomicrobiaceae bacterium]|nr:hypothetical protein [Verrucomicrobiaceae bacterium]
MKRCLPLILAAAVVWPRFSTGQTPAVPAAPTPKPKKEELFIPAPVINQTELDYATSVALAVGVNKLKELANADPQGWIIPPIQRVRITGYRDVPRKFRRIEVDRPIYEYTDLVVMVPGPSPGDPPQRQVRKVPTRQIDTKKEIIIRWDPNGPEEMIDKQPIYEHVGDTSWQFNLIGDSAMALTALRSAGLPESDLVVYKMAQNLIDYLETYGAPDHTWNVAQLAIALSKTPGDMAKEWTERLASRLLDGQIADGPARGLWGPMCMHPRVFAVVIRDFLAGEAEVERMKLKVKERPTKANQLLLDVAEGGRNRLKSYADSWSRLALRFATVEWPLVWDDQMTEKVQFGGATEYFYNQRAADMDSTWVALMALSECAAAERLPKESLRPEMPPSYSSQTKIGETPRPQATVKSQLNATTVPPENAIAVLARAANALATLLGDAPAWSECNIHQPVTDFDTFDKYLSVPVVADSFPPLDSPVTPVSAMQGAAALDAIGRIVGAEKMAKFLPKYEVGTMGRAKVLVQQMLTLWRRQNQKPSPAITKPELFGLLLAASRPLSLPVPEEADIKDTADLFTRMLILAADADGSWGSRFKRMYHPSSMRERWKTMSEMPNRVWRDWRVNLPVDINKAHIAYWHMASSEHTVSPGTPYATAVAVNYLASRLKDPASLIPRLVEDSKLAEQRSSLETILLPPPPPPQPKTPKPAPPPAPVAAKTPEPQKPAIVVPSSRTSRRMPRRRRTSRFEIVTRVGV